MAANERPEPNGWELLDAINEVKRTIADIPGKLVSNDTYQADKRGENDRFVRIEKAIDDIHSLSAERDKTEAAQREANDNFAKNQRLSWTLAIVGPIVVLIVGYIGLHLGIGGG